MSCCKLSKESLKCGEDEGDCDSDEECKNGLKCGSKDCPLAWPPLQHIECCYNETSKLDYLEHVRSHCFLFTSPLLKRVINYRDKLLVGKTKTYMSR